jgi:large subunit ribosomal protein L6
MSRVGKNPVPFKDDVKVELKDNWIKVSGPKGELEYNFHPEMEIEVKDNRITVRRPSDSKVHRALHGTTRSLVANMVQGVSEGFTRELEIQGVEYRAEVKGKTLILNLGYSHPVKYKPDDTITIEVPDPKKVKILGIDKQKVGQAAAEIRAFRPPEPYKGKGIRYVGEYVRKKAGKAAVGTGF